MYLKISEDGCVQKVAHITDDDKRLCEDGGIWIVMLHAENPLSYYSGAWHEMKLFDGDE